MKMKNLLPQMTYADAFLLKYFPPGLCEQCRPNLQQGRKARSGR